MSLEFTPANNGVLPKKKAALILKGGGIKGLAYVGALSILWEHYDFESFAGTSAGAIVALLLAAGYEPPELERELRKTSFGTFLDAGPFRAAWNLVLHGGLYEAAALEKWMDGLLTQKLGGHRGDIKMADIKKKVRIYSCAVGHDYVEYSNEDPIREGDKRSQTKAAEAARKSAGIPLFFTPRGEEFDGGVRHNYPVELFLRPDKLAGAPAGEGSQNVGMLPGGSGRQAKAFVGLYVRDTVYPTRISVLGALRFLLFDTPDEVVLRKFSENTVVIDTKPISTFDFSLSNEEKNFLVQAGRSAALGFLRHQREANVSEEKVREEDQKTQSLRGEIVSRRERGRRMRRWLCLTVLLSAALFCVSVPLHEAGLIPYPTFFSQPVWEKGRDLPKNGAFGPFYEAVHRSQFNDVERVYSWKYCYFLPCSFQSTLAWFPPKLVVRSKEDLDVTVSSAVNPSAHEQSGTSLQSEHDYPGHCIAYELQLHQSRAYLYISVRDDSDLKVTIERGCN